MNIPPLLGQLPTVSVFKYLLCDSLWGLVPQVGGKYLRAPRVIAPDRSI